MSKENIIQAVRALAKDVDLDPQSRYDMLGEIAAVLEAESDILASENDIDEDEYEWALTDDGLNFDDDFDDEDDEYDFDEEDEFDAEDW